MSLLTCRHLSVSYDGKAVLSDLNFSVDEGDYLGIVGENGAGKSTLVKALLRLKKISGNRNCRWLQAYGNRIPSPADPRAERFSRQCLGSRSFRPSEPLRHVSFLSKIG